MTARDPLSAAAPSHLSPASRRWYESISAEFVLGPHHLRILEAGATAWDEMEAARKLLDAAGLVIVDRFGQPCPHPATAIMRDARLAFVRCCRELALADEAPETRPPRAR